RHQHTHRGRGAVPVAAAEVTRAAQRAGTHVLRRDAAADVGGLEVLRALIEAVDHLRLGARAEELRGEEAEHERGAECPLADRRLRSGRVPVHLVAAARRVIGAGAVSPGPAPRSRPPRLRDWLTRRAAALLVLSSR